jgi:bacilliredoxin
MSDSVMSSPAYDADIVQPMRNELTSVGFKELLTADEVERSFDSAEGTVLVVVNSVCGCAAGNARPGISLGLQSARIPDHLLTAFAGQEKEAVASVRELMNGQPPSSPCVALLRNKEVLRILHREDLQGMEAQEVARDLAGWFDEFCTAQGPSIPREEFEKLEHVRMCGS